MPRVTPLAIALAVGGALAALRIGGCAPLDQLELRALDARFLVRGRTAAAPQVMVVGVDDASLTELGRWPWSRARVGDLLARISAGGATVIGVDLVQAEPTASCDLGDLGPALPEACRAEVARLAQRGPDEDAQLAAALGASGRVVLGYFFDFSRRDESPYEGESTYPQVLRGPDANPAALPLGKAVTSNLPTLNGVAAGLGYFNFLPDADGILRRAALGIRFHDRIALPLSLAMLQRAWPDRPPSIRLGATGVEAVRLGGESLPVDRHGQLLINFRGPGRTVRHISAADVLTGRTEPGVFREALVVLGVTAVGVGDVRATPVDPVYPGAELHASVLDNIVRRDFVRPPNWFGPDVAIILGLALGLAAVLQVTAGLAGALIAAGTLLGYAAASQWWFTHDGIALGVVYPTLAAGFTYVAVSVQHYVTVDREKRRTRRMLDLYLSPALSTFLSDRPETLQLGGEKSDRTVLFSDVKGFTTISERLSPEELVELLNEYLGEMTDVVFAHDGMLDKYIGDGVMAVWGAPVPQADHAARACRAALDMIDRLGALNTRIAERGWPPLHIRIGLNSGPMVFGNMGSRGHLSLTVMGDNVNLGARLEGVNKQYGTTILASEATIAAAGDVVVSRELDVVRVKGKDDTVRIYEVVGPPARAADTELLRERFAAGLAAYRRRDFTAAVRAFEQALDEHANDHPSALYLRRSRTHLATPPPETWEPVVTFDEK